MNHQNLKRQKDSDANNPQSFALAEFFDMVEKALERDGFSRREARAEAYYAVELRFNVSKERARAIMYSVREQRRGNERMRGTMYIDNTELMRLLKMANDEYDKQRKEGRGTC